VSLSSAPTGAEASNIMQRRIRALKQAELSAMGSVALHQLYFGSLGGDGAVAGVLRERGFDARFLDGGLSGWYAAGGARRLLPDPELQRR